MADLPAAILRYIDGDNGNDTTGTGSSAAPWKTLAKAKTETLTDIQAGTGVTWFLAGTFREAELTIAGAESLTIRQWPGATQWWLRGDTVIPAEDWTDNGDGTFSAAVASEPASVVWNWDTNIDAQGNHYGHLVEDAAVDSAGDWAWDSGTLTVRPPTGAEDPDTGDVYAYCRAGNGLILTDPVGCTISGGTTGPFPDASAGNGIALSLTGAVGCTVSGMTFWDGGYHHTQFAGSACTGNTYRSNTYRACAAGGTHDVFFSSGSKTTGCVSEGCTYYGVSLLKWNGTLLNTTGNVVGTYAHGGSNLASGSVEAGVRVIDPTFISFEANYTGLSFIPFGCQNTDSPTDVYDWETYAYKVIGGTYTNCSVLNSSAAHDFALVRADLTAGFGNSGTIATQLARVRVNSGRKAIFDACVIVADNAATAGWRVIEVLGDVVLLNNFLADKGATGINRTIVRPGLAAATVRAYGNVFARGATGPNYANGTASTDADAQQTWEYNVFVGVTNFNSNTDRDTKAEFSALYPTNTIVDAGMNTTDALDLTDWPTDVSPADEGFLATTASLLPAEHTQMGINGREWSGHYGAYQQGIQPEARLRRSLRTGIGIGI